MQDHNAESIKSLEGFRIAWTEEAQTLAARSLSLLRPTIRAPGSELWFSWNARRKTDPVDALLRGDDLPTGAVVVTANWRDNPLFPAELEQERLDCLRLDPDQYPHIWEGEYATVLVGAYYAKALAAAKAEGRICRVAADPLLPIRLIADIGGTGARADAFVFGPCSSLAERSGCSITTRRDRVCSVSYESALSDAGYDVEVVPNQGRGAAAARIESVRRVSPAFWFNESTTEPGREALGWYHERRDGARNIGLGPDHDWSSHGSDAFGLMSIAAEEFFRGDSRKPTVDDVEYYGGGGWMG
jgi:phage terminase large subunit